MTDIALRIFAVTYDNISDWSGSFFSNMEDAKTAMAIMRKEIMAGDDHPLIPVLKLESATASFPSTSAELLGLLNNGPMSILRDRKLIATVTLSDEIR
ncbi:hypothetical protein [Brucella sp. NBRC 12950]|uniref:hypothetical protein n=1 Tax=Brucella sp. NBRC 12950 TaxID=2994518 RepID=UPI0024A186E0|nr:hypothetical protein [Brucella sp. NBRC 12950]GLU29510.1 hypothetical protein Brsp01_47430 [Brucella sp. NBRC 12950]